MTTVFSISEVEFLEYSWFLIHFLDVGYVLEMLLFKFQVCRMFGMSSKTLLPTISMVGSLEDRWLLTHWM